MDLKHVRRLAILAMFSDDELMQRLVLKGGNALEIVHRVVDRGSVDLDFSMADEFANLDDLGARAKRALEERFGDAGQVVFDFSLAIKPSLQKGRPAWWGGYRIEFKLAERAHYERHAGDPPSLRRSSTVLGPGHARKFKIEISKHEFCGAKESHQLDDHTIYVYSLEMIALEKIRAICQQMGDYAVIGAHAKRARARDFYDIYKVLEPRDIDLGSERNLELARCIFDAKHVPYALIPRIEETREFHRIDWPAVADAIAGDLVTEVLEFDHYFDAVVRDCARLQPLWKE